MDEPTNETHGALDLDPLDRVQVAHLFLKAAHDGYVLTDKEAETAIKRMFPDLFEAPPLERLAAELLDAVERDGAKTWYSSNVRAALELIGVQLAWEPQRELASAPERP